MLRQLSRLALYLLLHLRNIVLKHPAASLGLAAGAVIGYVIGTSMAKYGFPGWVVPVQMIVWALALPPVVRNYLDKLK
jgi:hypothetical protein